MFNFFRSFLAIILLFTSSSIYAQQNYFKGYVLTNSGDTLKGYVKARETETSPIAVKYKPGMDAKEQNITIKDSRGFGVYDQETYERHLVTLSMGPVKIADIIGGIDTSSVRETVFLKVIRKGANATLYVHIDNVKKRYYIKEKHSEEPFELLLYKYYDNDGRRNIVVNSRFRNQISALFKQYGVAEKEENWLRAASYEQYDMNRALALINHEAEVQQKNAVKYPGYSWYVGAGAGLSKYTYKGASPLASSEATYKSSVSPYVAIGADFYANPMSRRLLFKTKLAFYHDKSEAIREIKSYSNTETYRHEFKQDNFTLGVQVVYNLYNGVNNKVYIGGGISTSYSSFSNNHYEYYSAIGIQRDLEPAVFNGFSWTAPLSLGVVVAKRYELSMGYELPTSLTNNGPLPINMKRFRAGLYYHIN